MSRAPPPSAWRPIANRAGSLRAAAPDDGTPWAVITGNLRRAIGQAAALRQQSGEETPAQLDDRIDDVMASRIASLESALGDGTPDVGMMRRLTEELTGRLSDAGATLANTRGQLEALKLGLEAEVARAKRAEQANATTTEQLRATEALLASVQQELDEGRKEASEMVGNLDDLLEKTQDTLRGTQDTLKSATT